MKKIFLVVIFLSLFNAVHSQENAIVIPFMKTGYGYFNDGLMIGGSVLSSEVGIKQRNGYSFSLNYKMAETLNSKGDFTNFNLNKAEFIYTYQIVTLYMGYEFITKNQKHSFIPQMGPFYSNQHIVFPTVDLYSNPIIINKFRPDIGFAFCLEYDYNLSTKISIGLNASGYLAYQMGPLYYSILPVISFHLN